MYLLSLRPTHKASLGALGSVHWVDLEPTVVGGTEFDREPVLGGVKGAYKQLVQGTVIV